MQAPPAGARQLCRVRIPPAAAAAAPPIRTEPVPTFLDSSARPRLTAHAPAPSADGPAGHLGRALASAPGLPGRLREALVAACAQPRPFLSVSGLAVAARCDRRTLWREWRRAVGPEAPLRLEDVLHWVILARALELKRAGRSWASVAQEVRVHPHTLGRFARRFTGRTLRQLEGTGTVAAHASLVQELLPALECRDAAA
jgi:hypothetical protein